MYEIKAYLQAHSFISRIAVYPSIVSREINRNGGIRRFDPKEAHLGAMVARMNVRKHTRFSDSVRKRVESLILSP